MERWRGDHNHQDRERQRRGGAGGAEEAGKKSHYSQHAVLIALQEHTGKEWKPLRQRQNIITAPPPAVSSKSEIHKCTEQQH